MVPPARVDSAEAERQQRLADLKAARESGLMAQVQSSRVAPVSLGVDPAADVSGVPPAA